MTSRDPFAASVKIAQAARSPMERAASALDPVRYNIFCATYASMRQIDDFVDDEFLAGSRDDPEGASAVVDLWEAHAVAAVSEGAPPPKDVQFFDTLEGLSAVAGVADLDCGPWRRLAGAMRRDIAGAAMPDWASFLDYAEGATAAPAAVFIEILALRPTDAGRLVSAVEGPTVERIRNAAVLLYLVHIMRDLPEDATRGLLTLPGTFFNDLGVDEATFAKAEPAMVAKGRAVIAEYAGRFLAPALGELASLDTVLSSDESAILQGLCTPYIERYEAFQDSL